MTDAEILRHIREAFTSTRPEQFADRTHCCECAEHNDLLLSRDLDTLKVEDIGNAGWDPICFATNEGFLYYFPALARIALDEPTHDYGWYFEQLLFHLTYKGSLNRRLAAASLRQREAIAVLLRRVQATRSAAVTEYRCDEDLQQALALWTTDTGSDLTIDPDRTKAAPAAHRER